VGAIDLAKAPKNALYLAKKPKKSPAAHEKCPVVDQKSLKLAPKIASGGRFSGPKWAVFGRFSGLRPGMP